MTIRDSLNGKGKPISIGAVTGLLVAVAAFVTLHLTLRREYRTEGASAATVVSDVAFLKAWVGDYERNVRPLRDEFLRLTGELRTLRPELDDLRMQIRGLNARLDAIDDRRQRGGQP